LKKRGKERTAEEESPKSRICRITGKESYLGRKTPTHDVRDTEFRRRTLGDVGKGGRNYYSFRVKRRTSNTKLH